MSYFVPDKIAMDREFRSWEGMVGRDLNRRLRTLEFRAQQTVGVSSPNPTRVYPGGALRTSIHIERETPTTEGLEGKVGSNRSYAKVHHEGSRPHVIVPRRRGGVLRFWWAKVGRIVYRKRVNHPGTRPNPYLTRWLKEAIR